MYRRNKKDKKNGLNCLLTLYTHEVITIHVLVLYPMLLAAQKDKNYTAHY